MSKNESVPVNSVTVSLSVTDTSSRVAYGDKRQNALVQNAGSAIAFVRSGSSTVTATTSHLPVLPGAIMTLTRDPEDTHLAAISASETVLYITSADGV